MCVDESEPEQPSHYCNVPPPSIIENTHRNSFCNHPLISFTAPSFSTFVHAITPMFCYSAFDLLFGDGHDHDHSPCKPSAEQLEHHEANICSVSTQEIQHTANLVRPKRSVAPSTPRFSGPRPPRRSTMFNFSFGTSRTSKRMTDNLYFSFVAQGIFRYHRRPGTASSRRVHPLQKKLPVV